MILFALFNVLLKTTSTYTVLLPPLSFPITLPPLSQCQTDQFKKTTDAPQTLHTKLFDFLAIYKHLKILDKF